MGRLDSEFEGFNTRKVMFEALKNESFIYWGNGSLSDFYKITQESVFTLCPRGFGPTSFRMYEAMALGSIPIYIWHEKVWLPYTDEIDWNKAAIIIPIEQIDQLKTILQSLTPNQIREKQEYIKSIFNNYFTMKRTCYQIIKTLEQNENNFPA